MRTDDPAIRLLLACCRADIGLDGPEGRHSCCPLPSDPDSAAGMPPFRWTGTLDQTGGGADEIVQTVRGVTDWDRVKALALRHRLVPLLHHWLASNRDSAVPAELPANFRTWLVEHFRTHTFRALGLTRELLRLLPLFAAQGIPVMAFKGPVLAQQLYGQVARREYVDLDLLVHEADTQAAVDLLRREGYQPEFPLTAEQLRRYLAMNCEWEWSSPQRGLKVDLHWALALPGYSLTFPESAVWQGAHHVVISGQKVQTLPPETLVPYLFYHHTKDDWGVVASLHDMAMVVRGFDGTAWERLMAEARERRMSQMVQLGAHLLHTLFQLPLPEPMTGAVGSDPRLLQLSGAANVELWNPGTARRKLHLLRRTMDSWVDVCRHWRIIVFQDRPPDWHLIDLPRPLHFLYLPLRLARLVANRLPYLQRTGHGANTLSGGKSATKSKALHKTQ